jgi:hypothetical protein
VVTPQVSAIIGAGINFETNFNTTSNQYLRLTLSFGAQASAWYSIAQFGIGPSNRTQSTANQDWVTYSISAGITGLGGGSVSSSGAKYRRSGETLHVKGYFQTTGTGTGGATVTVPLPSGLTINTASLPSATLFTNNNYLGTMTIYNGSTFLYTTQVEPTTSTAVAFPKIGTAAIITGADVPANSQIQFEFTVPIAEWASSALNLGPGAQVEYVFNNSATTANDTSSFGYGPAGFAIQNFAPSGTTPVTKRVQFQYPIQTTDQIVLEVQDPTTGVWIAFSDRFGAFSTNDANTTFQGQAIAQVASNQVNVAFYSATVGGGSWASINTWKWRVKKFTPSAPVGFGLAGTDGSSGLYMAGRAPGLATGAAISAGNVGQILTASLSNVSFTVSGTGYNLGQLTLTAGVWMVYCQMYCNAPGGSTKSLTAISLNTSAAFSSQYSVNSSSTVVSAQESMFIARPFTTDGATNNIAYCYGFMSYTGGSPATTAANSAMWAVRIG